MYIHVLNWKVQGNTSEGRPTIQRDMKEVSRWAARSPSQPIAFTPWKSSTPICTFHLP
ncbi:uncharacterized protein Dyak_GE15233 [Drosophila yakuba]|uniref:Uncharacterized protein n=1 Tax=Drosophila yakuba TaxID=7245 RepID=A0A0R1EEY6_DROYA|nr:uncharacterized protein Dyak_GE15233 [Drosophila yakuba]